MRAHVVRELRAAVACGDAAEGFLWVRCDGCRVNCVVAVSCKGRAACPRCGGRRMAQGAANLVEGLFPDVPVRQWVLSMPIDQRLALAWRPKLVRPALAIMVRHVSDFYRRRGGGHPGSVTVIQRFGSTLNLNVHFHVLFADGSWSTGDDGMPPVFRATAAPTLADVSNVVEAIAADLARMIPPRPPEGLAPDDAQQDLEMASLMNRSAFGHAWAPGGARKRGERRPRVHGAGLEASAGWTSLHAGVRIAATDRAGLERLCRYVLRPAVALSRLSLLDDDRIRLRLRHAWGDGTEAVEFTAEEFVGRLAAQVAPKGQHQIRYHGVFAPASPWRKAIVPVLRRRADVPEVYVDTPRRRWIAWGELILRVFGEDPQTCPRCGARMRQVALVLAGGGDVLAWLDDERAHQGGLVLLGARARGDPEGATTGR